MEAAPVTVMQRYEMKYILTEQQTGFLLDRLKGHMEPDAYGLTTIASLYCDTPDRRLIRASLEKPEFKEKLRLRSYGPATADSLVFLELKRKAYGVVYKRRVRSTLRQAIGFLSGEPVPETDGQIGRELIYFRDYYRSLVPTCMILYDRTAYCEPDGDLRLTIDRNPRFRTDDLRFADLQRGTPLLAPGETILEVKVQDAIPLWLVRILAEGGIRLGSFSKYGEAYRRQSGLHAV